MAVRGIQTVSIAQPALEGAGVSLRRAFGFGKTELYDPFLLLDDFRNDIPDQYRKGFPWHPHRGIETITYVTAGSVEHSDSIGNSGSITAGEVQWMTAGSGIIHQEMPKGDDQGKMYGFQLWANLSTAEKMTAPRYQQYGSSEIPRVESESGTTANIICGELWGTRGPVEGIGVRPEYFDISMRKNIIQTIPVTRGRHAFAYIIEGSGTIRDGETDKHIAVENRSLILFDEGDEVCFSAGPRGMRFLLVSGEPLKEPVAWHGPIVMNTRKELETAFKELEDGTFLKNQDVSFK